MKKMILLIAPLFLMAHTPYSISIQASSTSFSMILKDARKLAEYYRQRVLKGESMSSIAKLYSEDPGSASNGGQYNGITPGMMVPEFEKVAYRLKTGEVSEVFETQFGFHFIQLISRKGDTLNLLHVLITRD